MNTLFSSSFSQDMDRFLEFKRSLGHPYVRGEWTLRSFDHYVTQSTSDGQVLSFEELLAGWLSRIEKRKPVTVATDLGVIRQFCLYRRRYDPSGFVPSRDWAPQSTESGFLPYIFSKEEILSLLSGTETLRGSPYRRRTFRVLLLLLYCTGLRVGEAVRLLLQDVDLDGQVLLIRESKHRTRWVPFRRDIRREMASYHSERLRVHPHSPQSSFFIRVDGSSYTTRGASHTICHLLRKCGLKPSKGRMGPRTHDLRHTFAVTRLTEWYREGVDIHAHLPWLSAYMGHENILGTEKYLTATPDLLEIASRRFAKRFRKSEAIT